jgi:hypothetical protein
VQRGYVDERSGGLAQALSRAPHRAHGKGPIHPALQHREISALDDTASPYARTWLARMVPDVDRRLTLLDDLERRFAQRV